MVSTNINEQILRISVALLLLSVAAVSEARPIKKQGTTIKQSDHTRILTGGLILISDVG